MSQYSGTLELMFQMAMASAPVFTPAKVMIKPAPCSNAVGEGARRLADEDTNHRTQELAGQVDATKNGIDLA